MTSREALDHITRDQQKIVLEYKLGDGTPARGGSSCGGGSAVVLSTSFYLGPKFGV